MRLFIAICFTEEFREGILDIMEDLKEQGVRGNFTRKENLHLTLTFIGETDQQKKIIQVLRHLDLPACSLQLRGSGSFGDLYWVGLRREKVLDWYVRDLQTGLEEAGIRFDRKPFRPHITLVRRAQCPEKPVIRVPNLTMKTGKVSLMSSERVGGKLLYREIWAEPVKEVQNQK